MRRLRPLRPSCLCAPTRRTDDDFATLGTEDLFAYSTAKDEDAWNLSVASWQAAVKSLGVEPNDQVIRAILEPKRGMRREEHTSGAIVNAEEVRAVLADAGSPLNTMLSDR